ncbi:MAG TPA: UDP-N-acetylglucosamine 1-carboxyvinyltransferase [Chloroflexia bacterium]|nr:UDP-N-acetylglucosamine 1-carboxyvinyltransferase [Chloroflexia bacterium]
MEQFIVEGGHPLSGVLRPAGNKNAALPMLAGVLLADGPVTLQNVPEIDDLRVMLRLLGHLGVEIEQGDHEVRLWARDPQPAALDADLCRRVRTSLLLAGPLLARCGRADIGLPGGDSIGRRRNDTHLLALRALGAEVTVADSHYSFRADRLRGADLFLDEASVTGTEQAMLAACTAEGTTIVRNAASEPHVQDLGHFLNALGAQIGGIGSNTLEIRGVPRLHGGRYRVMSDHMEVGSFIGLAAITGSELRIQDAVPEHLHMTRLVFERLGVRIELDGNDVLVPGGQELRIALDAHGAILKIDDGPWPAFPSDLMSIALVVATQAEGTVLIFEKMFESRLFFVDKLIGMGARIVLCDPHRAVVIGRSPLHGDELASPDIRAGMALLTAALCARGTSVIQNVGQIDRGYERIEERLAAVGARIRRTR